MSTEQETALIHGLYQKPTSRRRRKVRHQHTKTETWEVKHVPQEWPLLRGREKDSDDEKAGLGGKRLLVSYFLGEHIKQRKWLTLLPEENMRLLPKVLPVNQEDAGPSSCHQDLMTNNQGGHPQLLDIKYDLKIVAQSWVGDLSKAWGFGVEAFFLPRV